MKRKSLILFVAIAMIVVTTMFSLTSCKMSVNDPSITDEDAKVEKVQLLAENGVWMDASEDVTERFFKMVKSFGELTSEPLDVAISGNSTIETTYDYTFKMSFSYGNFFFKKQGEFNYNVGERFVRTYTDGKENVRYSEDKLVVKRALSKDTATLSETQLAFVKETFEAMNESVMNEAVEKVVSYYRDQEKRDVDEVPQEELADLVFDLCKGSPLGADENLLKGYRFTMVNYYAYIFVTKSVEWAKELEKYEGIERVGRVCVFGGLSTNEIVEMLKS